MEICILLCSLNQYKYALEILSTLNDKEQYDRSYTLAAFIEHNLSKHEDTNQHILLSYEFLKKAIQCNFNHPLTNYMARILTLEIGDYNACLYGTQRMIDQDNQDFEALLSAAEICINLNDYTASLDFFLKFISVYSSQTYATHLIEFLAVNIDSKAIFLRAAVVHKLLTDQRNLSLTDEAINSLAICDTFRDKELSGTHINLSSPHQFTPSEGFNSHLIKMTIPELHVLGESKDTIKMHGCFAGPC